MKKYNHYRNLSDFKEYIDLIKAHGFNPIAVTQIYFEETFIFETSEEAKRAYDYFENTDTRNESVSKIIAWWYGKDSFKETVETYESNYETNVLIYWL